MKKLIIVIMVMLFCGNLFAENELETSLTTDYFSKYVWRGQNVVDEPVFQPSINMSYKRLSFTGWGNLDLTDMNDNKNRFTEMDIILDYSGKASSNLIYSLGFINYDFPDVKAHSTTEVYAGLSLDTFLSPSLTIYRDVDEVAGSYISLKVNRDFGKFKSSASLGWGDRDYNDSYWNKNKDGFNDLTLSLSIPIEYKGWTFSPSVSYITLIDDRIRESNNYGKDRDFVVFGLSLRKRF